MRNRPWPLVLLAIFQILTPVTNILFNAWALKVSPAYVVSWVFERSWLGIFETLFLMPIAGIAIWRMKGWSYVVFFAAMAWSMSTHLRYRGYVTGSFPSWAVTLVYAMEVLLVIYFLMPSVRKTYLDPSIRWWESKPRYEVDAPTVVQDGEERIGGKILNISEGGAFLSLPSSLTPGGKVEVRFAVFNQTYEIPAKVVHVQSHGGKGYNHGLQFLPDAEEAERLRNLVRGLKIIGFVERGGQVSWSEGLLSWLSTVLTTGKGLTPEIKERGRTGRG